jgi:hypothetical protein
MDLRTGIDECFPTKTGNIWPVRLPVDVRRRDDWNELLAAIGPVTLDGVPQRVVGVESHCTMGLCAGWTVGLLLKPATDPAPS